MTLKRSNDPALERRHAEAIRNWCNALKLWRLCGNAGCRRARLCRGNVYACGRTNAKLLPKAVRNWLELMLAGCAAKLSYEEIMAETADYPEHAAYEDWCRQVRLSLRR